MILRTLLLTVVVTLCLESQPAVTQQSGNGRIEGRVVEAGSGAPIAEVDLILEGGTGATNMAVTSAVGEFVLDKLVPGRYILRAERNGYVPQAYGDRGKHRRGVALSLGLDQQLTHIDFQLVRTSVIAGRVLGDKNDPQVGAKVEALALQYVQGRRRLVSVGEASTNDRGEYRIYGLSPGQYYVEATGEGLGGNTQRNGTPAERYVTTFSLSASNPNEAIVVSVRPGAESGADIIVRRSRVFHIRGKVLWAEVGDGHFLVPAILQRVEPGFGNVYRDIISDKEGNFDLDDIAPGSYFIIANANRRGEWYSAWQRIDVGNSDVSGVTLGLSRGVELRGSVRAEGDDNVDFGNVRVLAWPVHMAAPGVLSARVSPGGNFSLQNVPRDLHQIGIAGLPEDYYLKSVRMSNAEVSHRTIDLNAGDSSQIELTVSSTGGRIDGSVRNAKDEPAPGVPVVLVPDSSRRGERYLFRETTTDQNARFTIRGVPPGDYKLFAWDDVEPGASEDPEFLQAYEDKGEKVEIQANRTQSRDLRLITANPTPQ